MSSKENSFADRVFKNGSIYTVDKRRSWARAVALRGGEIIYVGDNQGVEKVIGQRTRVIDLDGKLMLPGFHDVHVHLYDGGMQSLQCDLWDCPTLDQAIFRMENYIQGQGPDAKGWIQCSGLQKTCAHEVSRDILDKLSPRRPIYILTFEHGKKPLYRGDHNLCV